MAIAPDEKPFIDTALRSTLLGPARKANRAESASDPELRVERIVDGVFMTVYGLLGIRLLLALGGVSSDGLFARLITAVTDPLGAVFAGIFPTSDGHYALALPVFLAILLYAVLHGVARAMLRKLTRRRAYL